MIEPFARSLKMSEFTPNQKTIPEEPAAKKMRKEDNSTEVESCKTMPLSEDDTASVVEDDIGLTFEQKLHYSSVYCVLSWRIACCPIDDYDELKALAREVKNLFEESIANKDETTVNFVKEHSDLKFCCGVVAYFLSEKEGVEDIALWFKHVFSKEMSRQNGLDLVKEAPGQQAYFFTQTFGDYDHDDNL